MRYEGSSTISRALLVVFFTQLIGPSSQIYPLPPIGFPYWGPLGWYGAAKFCPFIIGWNPGPIRGCKPGIFPPPPPPPPIGPPEPPFPPIPTPSDPPPPTPPKTESPEPAYNYEEVDSYMEEEEPEVEYKPKKRRRKCKKRNRNRY